MAEVTDNDTYTDSSSVSNDNQDGDVTVTINQTQEDDGCDNHCGCGWALDCCGYGGGYFAHHYNGYGCGYPWGQHYGHGHGHHRQPNQATVTVKKMNVTNNFGGAYIPTGYHNNQGGGQGAVVTERQQTVSPSNCGCCGNGDVEPVERVVTRTFNYTTTENNNLDSDTDVRRVDPDAHTHVITHNEGEAVDSDTLNPDN